MRHIFGTRKGAAFRTRILTRDLWTCQMCGVLLKPGKRDPRSAVVDHIRPVTLRPDLAWDEGNCRSVCKADHDGPCASIEARHAGDAEAIAKAKLAYHPGGYSETGRPLDPSHPWNAA